MKNLVPILSFSAVLFISGCNSAPEEPIKIVAPTPLPKIVVVIPTPRPTPTPKPKFFSTLRLLRPKYNGRKVTVAGNTDLPEGAEIDVSFKVTGRADTETYLGVDEKVQVQNSKFSAQLEIPDRPAFGDGRYEVAALFTPNGQSADVVKQVGAQGQRLRGSKVEMFGNIRTLSAVRPSRHRVKLTVTNYVMVKPSKYQSGSAERAFAEFMVAWKEQNWDSMSAVCQKTWIASQDNPADSLQSTFDIKDLLETRIISVTDATDMTPDGMNVKDVTAHIRYSVGSEAGVMGFRVFTKTIKARVIRESAPYAPSPDGEWGVNPISVQDEE